MSRWLRSHAAERGRVIDLAQTWRLAKAWYADPRESGWRARTVQESQAVLTSVGLTGEFWQLPVGK